MRRDSPNSYEVDPGALALATWAQDFTRRERRFPKWSEIYEEARRIHENHENHEKSQVVLPASQVCAKV